MSKLNSLKMKIIAAHILVLCAKMPVNAQNYLGVQNSNYAGVMGTDLQPASFVDGRLKFDLNIFSFNFNAYTNAVAFDTKGMPNWWRKSFGDSTVFNSWAKPDSTFDKRYIIRNFSENSTNKLGFYNNIQLDLFNFMFHINKKIAVGFSAKVRSITNVDNVDSKLAFLGDKSLNYPALWNTNLNEGSLSMNHLSWTEIGINYAQVLRDKDQHFFKIGGRINYLSGLASAYMATNNLHYDLRNADSTNSFGGDFQYGYSGNIDGYIDGSQTGPPTTASNFGWSLNLGVVYEWRPKWKDYKYDMDGKTNIWRRDKEKYKVRAGISLLDIGGMRFQKGGMSRDFSVNSTTLNTIHLFDKVTTLQEFDQRIDSLTKNSPDWKASQNTSSTYFMKTPAALSFQVDYHIWKSFYINATGMINLLSSKTGTHVHVANQLSITPSFDYKWVGLFIPISYNTYTGLKAGVATRLGPLTLGVTDFRPLFAVGNVSGLEFFLGARFPIFYGRPKDRDNDKVSDRKDKCATTSGTWEFRGCPDKDGDKIIDQDDKCPDVAGLKEFDGCPDKDGDKIIDKDDKCPDVAGLKEFAGCPDTDKDSIQDSEDNCPDIAGLKAFKGCPDTDKDGVQDKEDNCPEVAGPVENKGCPFGDKDNDGVADNLDACPELAGPRNNKGCPVKTEIKEREKVPVERQELQLNTAFNNIVFENGKAVIREVSFNTLDQLTQLLKENSTWKLNISGHTDNVGEDAANKSLSERRAEAVRTYLIGKGIDASRISSEGFGETIPLKSNDTPEGRSANRRVEFRITQ